MQTTLLLPKTHYIHPVQLGQVTLRAVQVLPPHRLLETFLRQWLFGDDHTNNIDPNLVGTNPTYGPSEPAGSHQTSNSVPAPSTNFYDPRELGDLEAPPLIPGVRGSGLNSGSHNRKDSTNSVNSDKSLSSEAWSMQTTPEQQQYEAFRTPLFLIPTLCLLETTIVQMTTRPRPRVLPTLGTSISVP